MLSLKNVHSNVCLGFLGVDTILAHAKAWDLVLWKCPGRSTTLYTSTEMCLYLDSDVWTRCFTIIFVGSFHYFKPVSCWILFCENAPGIPWPFNQLSLRVGKGNTFKMRLYFDSDIWGRCLTIIFVGSYPYFKFLTKINSKARQK